MTDDRAQSAEEIVRALEEIAVGCSDCPSGDHTVCGADCIDRYILTEHDLIVSLLARVAELEGQLSASQQETREAVDKAISWGANLIECNTDAHVTFCAECRFPIADYGVDREVFCTMCKSQNHSHNHVVTGPGSCRTTADRKAKVYDKLFGRGPQEESFISKTIDGVETSVIIRRGPQEAGEEKG